jgi:hypothetical protein
VDGDKSRRAYDGFFTDATWNSPDLSQELIEYICDRLRVAAGSTLVAPLDGVDYWLSDGDPPYNGTLAHHERCLVHELRQLVRSDERVTTLRQSGEFEELRSYLETIYEEATAERVTVLREEYPVFWDEEAETFTGPLSTNAIEGGNWRLKYGLQTPYARCRGALARTALLALDDSKYVFRNGRPEVSFAHRVGGVQLRGRYGPVGHRLARYSRTGM